MTSHKIFKLPLDLKNKNSCNFNSDKEKKHLIEADVIIWDEASMIPLKAFELADREVRDCCNKDNLSFAGKIVILGGDFRQILPIVKNGLKNDILGECIKFSKLWNKFKQFKLNLNMRAIDRQHQNFLLEIGEGRIQNYEIPDEQLTDNICDKIYNKDIQLDQELDKKIILCTHNDDVHNLNKRMLSKLNTKQKTYYTIDYIRPKGTDMADEEINLNYPPESHNNIKIPSIPDHELTLKIGAVIILLRNLCTKDGLCNGTRLQILELFEYNIKAKIISRSYQE